MSLKENNSNFRIMMIGTAMDGKGGIASVVRGYSESGIMRKLGIDYFPTHRDGSRMVKTLFYVRGLVNIIKNLSHYHIIHVHMASWWSFRRLFPIIVIANSLKKKIIIHVHGAMFHLYSANATPLEKRVIQIGFSSADRVIALSSEWKEKLSAFYERSKIRAIPNGVEIRKGFDDAVGGKSTDVPRLLFLGEIGKRKGVFDLLSALKLLTDHGILIKAFLCGNGEIDLAKRRIKELGLQELVSVPGWVSGYEKQRLLEEAYVYVLPSHNEGLPVSILEAMANAIPVICTPVGGIPDAVIDEYNGLLVPVESPHILAERIKTLLEDRQLWRKMARNAFATVELKFSMSRIEAQLKELYTELLDSR